MLVHGPSAPPDRRDRLLHLRPTSDPLNLQISAGSGRFTRRSLPGRSLCCGPIRERLLMAPPTTPPYVSREVVDAWFFLFISGFHRWRLAADPGASDPRYIHPLSLRRGKGAGLKQEEDTHLRPPPWCPLMSHVWNTLRAGSVSVMAPGSSGFQPFSGLLASSCRPSRFRRDGLGFNATRRHQTLGRIKWILYHPRALSPLQLQISEIGF